MKTFDLLLLAILAVTGSEAAAIAPETIYCPLILCPQDTFAYWDPCKKTCGCRGPIIYSPAVKERATNPDIVERDTDIIKPCLNQFCPLAGTSVYYDPCIKKCVCPGPITEAEGGKRRRSPESLAEAEAEAEPQTAPPGCPPACTRWMGYPSCAGCNP